MSEAVRKLLVVEDDEGLQRQLRWSYEDYNVVVAGDRGAALDAIRAHAPAVVTLDLGLPPDPDGTSEGFATLTEILRAAPDTKVIVASGHGARESALRAIAAGAFDFYQKPVDIDELGMIVRRAYHVADLEAENRRLASQAAGPQDVLGGIITGSPEMLKVARMIERVAGADVSVMLLGASGTGKELLARGLHNASLRAAKPFIAINCAAIPENLLESELFGYEKGAFTGAAKTTEGKIELAEGGTLFLDEVGDIPLPLQVKLLRFLQERVIERIGGRRPIPVDVRIVCATHQNLEDMIATPALPRGPLLSSRGDRRSHPEPRRAARRRDPAGASLPRQVRARARPLVQGLYPGRGGGDDRLALARQCPRAGEPPQARRDHVRGHAARRQRPRSRRQAGRGCRTQSQDRARNCRPPRHPPRDGADGG